MPLPAREAVRICGQEIPTGVVKSRFLKLNSEHISYVMDGLKSNTAKIGNMQPEAQQRFCFSKSIENSVCKKNISKPLAVLGEGKWQ